MSENDWEQIEVENKLFIPFKWKDDVPGGGNLGRAEFQVCLKSVRGKLKEFWVYPRQQRLKTCWHCIVGCHNDFTINSYEGLDNAWIWLIAPCKEHKAVSFSIYVPEHARYLEINHDGIGFWLQDYSDKPFAKISKMLTKADVFGIEDGDLIHRLESMDKKERR